ncbi:MAG: InlB B-repeat-containing protein, partial [Alphaproteobacteria bacterium]|nr:InlB B-repeat-containing protein [Alphaproteobacteria bacterium]
AIKQIGTICFAIFSILFSAPTFADPDISSSASSADCKYAPLETYSGTSNLSANWSANEIDLHWYNDDTELTVPAASQSCTYDGTLTPPATIPTKTGYTFKGWTVRDVPDGYTKLQYIESTGTQYINTGVVQDTINFQVNLVVSFANANTRYIYGVSSSSPMYFGRYTNGRFEQNQQFTSLVSGVNKRVNLQWGKNSSNNLMKLVVTVDNQSETLVSTASGTVTNKNFLLFANNGNSVNSILSGRIYSAQIYKNGVLAFSGVPAKNSSNVVGMWDTVTKTFFENAGTGTFTAGPAVQ